MAKSVVFPLRQMQVQITVKTTLCSLRRLSLHISCMLFALQLRKDGKWKSLNHGAVRLYELFALHKLNGFFSHVHGAHLISFCCLYYMRVTAKNQSASTPSFGHFIWTYFPNHGLLDQFHLTIEPKYSMMEMMGILGGERK